MKIKIKVHANSSLEKIVKISERDYEVWIKKLPFEGKANVFLEKFLKKYFNKNCKIISGFRSNIKSIEILDN